MIDISNLFLYKLFTPVRRCWSREQQHMKTKRLFDCIFSLRSFVVTPTKAGRDIAEKEKSERRRVA